MKKILTFVLLTSCFIAGFSCKAQDKSKRPSQLNGGPGNAGSKLPAIPTSIKQKPMNNKKYSINYFYFYNVLLQI